MINLLAIKYPSSLDIKLNRDTSPVRFSVETETEVKHCMAKLLCKEKYDYVLIKLNGKLFICELIAPEKAKYTYRQIHYHPYEDRLTAI